MAKWYYRIRNEEHGPVPDLGLAALLADGTLGPTDEVRMDGEFEWRPASAALSFHAAQASTDSWSAGELDDLLGEETPVIHARRRERNVAEGQEPPADPMTAGADDLDSLLGEEAPVIAPRAKPAAAPVVAEASPGEPAWYYKSLGQEIGPVPYSEITRLAQEGELHPNDFVRPGEAGAWQRAGRITGLFPDNYEATQAQLREAAAKVSLSSQRFGEKGMAALEAEIANPTPKDEDDEPEPPPQKPAKSKKKKKSREKIKDVDEFAASVLAEEVEEETPPPRTRSEAPAEPRQPARTADPAYAETRPMTSSPTPMPPTRSYTPPPPPAVAGFKRGPQSKSSGGGGGFSLPFDAQKAGIAAAVVLVLAGGYFIPWGKVLKSGDGPAPEIYHRAVFMWGKIRVLRDDKKAKQPDWEMLESELVTNINLQIAELKPYSTELATNLVKFEESMKEILAQGKSHPPELYKDAEGYLDKAKAALPKK